MIFIKKTVSISLAIIIAFTTLFSFTFTIDAKTKKYVKSIKASLKKVSIKTNKSATVKIAVKVANKASKKFSVKSSDNKIATAKGSSEKIKISAVSKGKCNITVTTIAKNKKGKKLKAKIGVTVFNQKKKKTTPKELTPATIPFSYDTPTETASFAVEPLTSSSSATSGIPTEVPSIITTKPLTETSSTTLETPLDTVNTTTESTVGTPSTSIEITTDAPHTTTERPAETHPATSGNSPNTTSTELIITSSGATVEATTKAPEIFTQKPSETGTSITEKTIPATQSIDTVSFHYLPSIEQAAAGYNYKLAVQEKDGKITVYDFIPLKERIDGIKIYYANIPVNKNITVLHYQVYDDDVWINQISVPASQANGKIIKSDGTAVGNTPVETTTAPEHTTDPSETSTASKGIEEPTNNTEGTTIIHEYTTTEVTETLTMPEETEAPTNNTEGTTIIHEYTTTEPTETLTMPEEIEAPTNNTESTTIVHEYTTDPSETSTSSEETEELTNNTETTTTVTETVTVKDSVGIVSFKATHAKIFKLAFTEAVPKDDREKITITVKKGSATMDMKKEWAEDGSSVDLSTDANLEATDYTVAIASDTVSIDDDNKTANTTVEKYGIKDVKITTKRVNKVNLARIYFDAIDNYGDKIVNTGSDTFNWQISCDDTQVKTTTFNPNYNEKDFITLDNFGDNDNNVVVDKTVIGVQAILKSDATIKSGRVDIEVKSIKIAKADILGIAFEGETEHIYEESITKTYKLMVDAIDNFGDSVDWAQYHPGTNYSRYNNEFNSYSDNPTLLSNPYFDPSTKEISISVYANKHGKAKICAFVDDPDYKICDIEVLAARKPIKINFPAYNEYLLIAKEDKDVKIPVTFTDQYGDEMLKNSIDNSLFASTFSPILSDNNLIAGYSSTVEGDFIIYNTKNVSFTTTERISVTYSTYDDEMNLVQSTFNFMVDGKRKPNSIKFLTSVPESMVVGETLDLDFQITDNSGEDWQDNTALTVTPITTGIDTYVYVSVGSINTDGTGTVTVTGLQDSTVNKDPKLPLKFKLTYGGEEIASTTFPPPTVTVYPNLGGSTEIKMTPSPLTVYFGQPVKLTLQAMKSDTEKLNTYTHTYKDVQFTQMDFNSGNTTTDVKDVVFRNGVAEVEINARLTSQNLKFYACIDAIGYGLVNVETNQMVKVNVGATDDEGWETSIIYRP